jgi:hypothetical protein
MEDNGGYIYKDNNDINCNIYKVNYGILYNNGMDYKNMYGMYYILENIFYLEINAMIDFGKLYLLLAFFLFFLITFYL